MIGTSLSDKPEAASCILFLLSVHSNDLSRSDQLSQEFDCAIRKDKLVLAAIDDIARNNLQGAFRIKQAISLTRLPALDRWWDVDDASLELLLSSIRALLFSNKTLPDDVASLRSGIDALAEMARLIGGDLSDPVSAAAFKRAHRVVKDEGFDEIRARKSRYGGEASASFTYFDIFNNISHMIYLRQDAAMTIRGILKNANPTQEELNTSCREIYLTLVAIRSLIGDFYDIAREIKDERYLRLPISMHKMMSETRFAINALIQRLGFDERTGQNHTDLLTNAASRTQIEALCDHLEQTVKFLCEINVDQNQTAKWSSVKT